MHCHYICSARKLLAFSTVLAMPLFFAAASGSKDALKRGWDEYEFGIFDIARKHFREVLADRDATSQEQSRALIGLAFCSHFGKGASASVADFEEALRNYSKALEKASGDDKLTGFIKSMMAEARFLIYLKTGDKAELAKADSIWDAMLAEDRYSIFAANGVLYRASFGNERLQSLEEKAKFIEEYLEGAIARKDISGDEKLLLPALSRLLAEMFISLEDYNGAAKWFEEYLKFGATSMVIESQALFKLARIYETKLGNKAKAREYYRAFIEKNPNDVKTYFAIEKVKELSAEQ